VALCEVTIRLGADLCCLHRGMSFIGGVVYGEPTGFVMPLHRELLLTVTVLIALVCARSTRRSLGDA
jgi:hypothetical protein